MLKMPNGLTITRVSPTINELEFIHNWCSTYLNKGCKILEFGAGPSTWAIHSAVKPSLYVAVEDWVDTIKEVSRVLPDVKIIKTLWYDIPEEEYDFIFVDSSAGYPPGDGGLHRDEAVKFSEKMLSDNGYYMLHDWHKRSGKAPRKYLEQNNYKLIDKFENRTGVGIYQKCK